MPHLAPLDRYRGRAERDEAYEVAELIQIPEKISLAIARHSFVVASVNINGTYCHKLYAYKENCRSHQYAIEKLLFLAQDDVFSIVPLHDFSNMVEDFIKKGTALKFRTLNGLHEFDIILSTTYCYNKQIIRRLLLQPSVEK